MQMGVQAGLQVGVCLSRGLPPEVEQNMFTRRACIVCSRRVSLLDNAEYKNMISNLS